MGWLSSTSRALWRSRAGDVPPPPPPRSPIVQWVIDDHERRAKIRSDLLRRFPLFSKVVFLGRVVEVYTIDFNGTVHVRWWTTDGRLQSHAVESHLIDHDLKLPEDVHASS
jgi:hypothetical protein